MTDRFEQFTGSVFRIYQSIQKIQRQEMAAYGLKSAHVACLLALQQHPAGITAAQLGKLCEKDKAAISRTVGELEHAGMVCRQGAYRAALQLTGRGHQVARALEGRTALAVEKAGEGLTEHDREIMYGALGRIADNLQAICLEGLQEEQEEVL